MQCAVLSRDDEWLITGSWDQTAIIRDLATGKVIYTTPKHSYMIDAVAITSDKKHLLTSASLEPMFESEATLWELPAGKKVRGLGKHNIKGVRTLILSKDDKQLVTAGDDTKIIWSDMETGKTIRSQSCPQRSTANLSNDGKHLIVGGDSGGFLFDMATGAKIRQFSCFPSGGGQLGYHRIFAVALSADGKRLATACGGGAGEAVPVCLWDTSTGWPLCGAFSCPDGAWGVIDVHGRMDYGREPQGVHWRRNDDFVPLAQLRDRLFDARLLAKHMGFNARPLRDIGR